MSTNEKEEPSSKDGYYISRSKKKESVWDAELGLCSDPDMEDTKIYDYFNGLLNGKDRDRVRQHLVACSSCQRTLMKLHALYLLLKEKADVFFAKDKNVPE